MLVEDAVEYVEVTIESLTVRPDFLPLDHPLRLRPHEPLDLIVVVRGGGSGGGGSRLLAVSDVVSVDGTSSSSGTHPSSVLGTSSVRDELREGQRLRPTVRFCVPSTATSPSSHDAAVHVTVYALPDPAQVQQAAACAAMTRPTGETLLAGVTEESLALLQLIDAGAGGVGLVASAVLTPALLVGGSSGSGGSGGVNGVVGGAVGPALLPQQHHGSVAGLVEMAVRSAVTGERLHSLSLSPAVALAVSARVFTNASNIPIYLCQAVSPTSSSPLSQAVIADQRGAAIVAADRTESTIPVLSVAVELLGSPRAVDACAAMLANASTTNASTSRYAALSSSSSADPAVSGAASAATSVLVPKIVAHCGDRWLATTFEAPTAFLAPTHAGTAAGESPAFGQVTATPQHTRGPSALSTAYYHAVLGSSDAHVRNFAQTRMSFAVLEPLAAASTAGNAYDDIPRRPLALVRFDAGDVHRWLLRSQRAADTTGPMAGSQGAGTAHGRFFDESIGASVVVEEVVSTIAPSIGRPVLRVTVEMAATSDAEGWEARRYAEATLGRWGPLSEDVRVVALEATCRVVLVLHNMEDWLSLMRGEAVDPVHPPTATPAPRPSWRTVLAGAVGRERQARKERQVAAADSAGGFSSWTQVVEGAWLEATREWRALCSETGLAAAQLMKEPNGGANSSGRHAARPVHESQASLLAYAASLLQAGPTTSGNGAPLQTQQQRPSYLGVAPSSSSHHQHEQAWQDRLPSYARPAAAALSSAQQYPPAAQPTVAVVSERPLLPTSPIGPQKASLLSSPLDDRLTSAMGRRFDGAAVAPYLAADDPYPLSPQRPLWPADPPLPAHLRREASPGPLPPLDKFQYGDWRAREGASQQRARYEWNNASNTTNITSNHSHHHNRDHSASPVSAVAASAMNDSSAVLSPRTGYRFATSSGAAHYPAAASAPAYSNPYTTGGAYGLGAYDRLQSILRSPPSSNPYEAILQPPRPMPVATVGPSTSAGHHPSSTVFNELFPSSPPRSLWGANDTAPLAWASPQQGWSGAGRGTTAANGVQSAAVVLSRCPPVPLLPTDVLAMLLFENTAALLPTAALYYRQWFGEAVAASDAYIADHLHRQLQQGLFSLSSVERFQQRLHIGAYRSGVVDAGKGPRPQSHHGGSSSGPPALAKAYRSARRRSFWFNHFWACPELDQLASAMLLAPRDHLAHRYPAFQRRCFCRDAEHGALCPATAWTARHLAARGLVALAFVVAVAAPLLSLCVAFALSVGGAAWQKARRRLDRFIGMPLWSNTRSQKRNGARPSSGDHRRLLRGHSLSEFLLLLPFGLGRDGKERRTLVDPPPSASDSSDDEGGVMSELGGHPSGTNGGLSSGTGGGSGGVLRLPLAASAYIAHQSIGLLPPPSQPSGATGTMTTTHTASNYRGPHSRLAAAGPLSTRLGVHAVTGALLHDIIEMTTRFGSIKKSGAADAPADARDALSRRWDRFFWRGRCLLLWVLVLAGVLAVGAALAVAWSLRLSMGTVVLLTGLLFLVPTSPLTRYVRLLVRVFLNARALDHDAV